MRNGAHAQDVTLVIAMIVAEMFDGGRTQPVPDAPEGVRDPDCAAKPEKQPKG